jgi:hypothetical protein
MPRILMTCPFPWSIPGKLNQATVICMQSMPRRIGKHALWQAGHRFKRIVALRIFGATQPEIASNGGKTPFE